MILPASYANGFAPRDGQPLYPSLWRGCVGSWAPCLGPTGVTLRDWSGFGRHSALTNMDPASDWIASGGRYALDVDGTNDYLLAATPQSVLINAIEFWWQPRTTITSATSEQDILHLRQSSDWYVALGASTALVTGEYFTIRDSSGSFATSVADGGSITSGTLHHFLLSWSTTDARYNIWIDGVQKTLTAAAGGHARQVTANLMCFGAYYNAGTPNTFSNGVFGGLSLWTQPMHQFVSLLGSRRGIANDLAPRRRSAAAVPAFNRRRRLLIGASS